MKPVTPWLLHRKAEYPFAQVFAEPEIHQGQLITGLTLIRAYVGPLSNRCLSVVPSTVFARILSPLVCCCSVWAKTLLTPITPPAFEPSQVSYRDCRTGAD
jgi:hypothetical protein